MKFNLGLLVLRLGFGLMMLFGHGWGKLTNFSSSAGSFPDPLGVGPSVSMALVVFAEFFCALAIAIGLFTRWATLPLLATMLVAGLIFHGSDPWAKKELALLYAVSLISIFLLGPGRFSLDSLKKPRSG